MDRNIDTPGKSEHTLFKKFEYIDLLPYAIALLGVFGEVYILTSFLNLSAYMHRF